MAQFHVVIIPGGEVWFQEIAETLLYGLRGLGHAADLGSVFAGSGFQNIVLGAHLVRPEAIPAGSVIYNFEQLGGAILQPQHYEWGGRSTVWDYSRRHVPLWKEHGVKARHVELGYVPEMTRIPEADEDIDVLFYGSPNARRLQIITGLEAAGLRVVSLCGVFGAERDAHIARAKVVVNVHYYETKTFEIARVAYLLANRKAVVTEASADEADYEYLHGGLVSVPYECLVEACWELVGQHSLRNEIRAAGFEKLAARRETEILRECL